MKKLSSKFAAVTLAVVLSISMAACAPQAAPVEEKPVVEAPKVEEMPAEETAVADAVDAYFSNMGADLYKVDEVELVEKVKAGEDMYIMDIRTKEDYDKGHLKNAVNVPWGPAIAENLDNLPADKQIYLYCYTGQTAGQTTALLNMAGYNVKSANFGWNLGLSQVPGIEEVTSMEATEIVASTPADTNPEVRQAITDYYNGLADVKGSTYANYKISEDDAKALLDAKDDSIMFLSVRKAEDYAKGHIEGAENIPFGNGMQESFGTLPMDKKIIVYCYTGQTAGQAVAGLRMLGYDAVSLNSGMGSPKTAENGWINKGYPVVTQ